MLYVLHSAESIKIDEIPYSGHGVPNEKREPVPQPFRQEKIPVNNSELLPERIRALRFAEIMQNSLGNPL